MAVKQCFTGVRTQTCGLASSVWTPTPGKPGLTSRAKGAVSSTATLEARRAGCVERRSSGSREAAVSKAHQESIYSFYPMLSRNTGDRDRPGLGPAVVLKWVMPTVSANPSGGFGTKEVFGSFNLGRRGEPARGDACSRADDKARCSAERADSE